MSAFIEQAGTDWELKQKQRRDAAASLGNIRKESTAGVTRLETAQGKAMKGIGQKSAQSMAATLGQVGGAPTGGGQVAAMRQAGMDRGIAEAAMGQSQAQAMGDARLAAAEKTFETNAAEAALGTLTGDRQAKLGQIEQNLQNLIGQYLSGTLGIGDDVGAFQTAANALIAAEGDPQVRAEAQRRINEIVASQGYNIISGLLYPLTSVL